MKTIQLLNNDDIIKLTHEYLGNEVYNVEDVNKLFKEKVASSYAKKWMIDIILYEDEDTINNCVESINEESVIYCG